MNIGPSPQESSKVAFHRFRGANRTWPRQYCPVEMSLGDSSYYPMKSAQDSKLQAL